MVHGSQLMAQGSWMVSGAVADNDSYKQLDGPGGPNHNHAPPGPRRLSVFSAVLWAWKAEASNAFGLLSKLWAWNAETSKAFGLRGENWAPERRLWASEQHLWVPEQRLWARTSRLEMR